jgi:hypothetical protein
LAPGYAYSWLLYLTSTGPGHPNPMSFTTPPNLTQPDTSADIIRPRKLGTVNCINVARVGEPILRYFGASALCGATGQAHPTQEQAEADVLAWADGKPVAYEQHAVVPLGCVVACAKKPALKAYQAWEASQISATQYLQPGDEVDEEMFDHFAGVVSPHYHTGKLLQVGEAQCEDRGRFLYMTFGCFGERYLYLGILPPFKQPKY